MRRFIKISMVVTILTSFGFVAEGASLPVINDTSALYGGRYDVHTEANIETLNVMRNCTLSPKLREGNKDLAKLVNDGNTQVKVSIEIDGDNGPLSENYTGHIFRPYNWIIVTSLTGKSMLMLKEYFVEMSIQTFGQGVIETDLLLVQNPNDCLKNKTQEDIENTVRSLFLTNFEPGGALLREGVEICNRHVQEIGSKGQVVYICCNENAEKGLECSEVHRTTLMKVLFQFITVLKWIVVSCFPLFIPYFIYKVRSEFRKYIFETEPDDDMEFNILKVSKLSETDSKTFEKAKIQPFTHMSNFKNYIKNKVEFDTVYKCHVKGILLTVRNSKIIAKGRAPVSVLSFLSNFFVKCKARHVIPSGNECCDANICRCWKHDCSKKSKCTYFNCVKCTWLRCLKYPMELIAVAACFVPLGIRLIYYILYERPFIRDQIELMKRRDLSLYIDNNEITQYPLTNLLSSDYYFVIIVFILIPIELLIYKLIFPDDLKREVKLTFRKSVRDMRLTKKSELCSCYVGMSIRPLQICGVAGIFVFPFFFLLLCVPFAIEIIPVCNFIGRLLKNANDEIKTETLDKSKLIFYVISHCLIVVSLFLILVLIMECISFYVEWLIYVLIGFILNPGVSLRYASMIVLITVYGHECFSGVHNRYVAYNNAINSKVVEMIGEKIKTIASLSEEEQDNTVFRVPAQTITIRNENRISFETETTKKCNTLFPFTLFSIKSKEKKILNSKVMRRVFERGSEGFLKLRVPRLVLFLDKSDIMYFPKSFLIKMANLPHYLCPGPVHLLYLKAVADFLLIIIFLVFVFIVIFAFGQVQDISSGGQTIAALGSGLLPLFLRRFLFRSHGTPDVDSSDIQWRYMFENAVQKYSERWNFEDIIVSSIEEVNPEVKENKADNSVISGATNKQKEHESETIPRNVQAQPHLIIVQNNSETKWYTLKPDAVVDRKKRVDNSESSNTCGKSIFGATGKQTKHKSEKERLLVTTSRNDQVQTRENSEMKKYTPRDIKPGEHDSTETTF